MTEASQDSHPHVRRAALVITLLSLAAPLEAMDVAGPQSGTWFATDTPHVVTGDIEVTAGESLNIEAGCVVSFRLNTALRVEGVLVANGRTNDPVVFRSDDDRPVSGDWGGITVAATGTLDLRHSAVRDAVTGVWVDGGQLTTDGTWVTGNLENGVVLEAGSTAALWDSFLSFNGETGLRIRDSSPLVSGCDFRYNTLGVQLRGNAFPSFTNCSSTSNTARDGIHVDTAWPITSLIGAWQGGGMPYVLDDGSTLTIEADAQLTLLLGTTVKAGTGAKISVRGILAAGGIEGGECLFTSLADDTAHGDTNRDGTASGVAKGDWSGIEVEDGGRLNLRRTEVRFGQDGVRVFTGGDAELRFCEVHHTADRGLAYGTGATGLIEGSHFHDNDTGIMVLDPDGLAMGLPLAGGSEGGGNTFGCNDTFDLDNPTLVTLLALRNFWRGSGPPAPTTVNGPLDTGDWLPGTPEVVLNASRLLVTQEDGNLLFHWSESSSCALYRVHRAEAPNQFFVTLSPEGVAEDYTDIGGAAPLGEDDITFYLLNTTL